MRRSPVLSTSRPTTPPTTRCSRLGGQATAASTRSAPTARAAAAAARPHLPSQGSVVLSGDGRHLLVANAGSDDVSVFAVGTDGLTLAATVASGGAAPRSIAVHDELVYVLNTGDPSLAGFRLVEGGLEPIAGSRRQLAADADPAQVGFCPDGSTLVVTERGADAIAAFPVATDGLLGDPFVHPSSGPTPYGFAFTSGRDAGRDRGVPRGEGQGRRLVVPARRGHGRAGHPLARQRPQRDLLGGGDQGRPLRLHDQLRRRRRLALRDRRRTAASRSRTPPQASPSTGRPACATRTSRRRPVPVRDRRRRAPDLRLGRRRRRLARADRLVGAASPRPSPDSPRADARQLRLEPLYRATFTTPESWSVDLEGTTGTEGQSFLIAEGRTEGRLSARLPGGELPAPPGRRRAHAGLPGRARNRRRRDGAVLMARLRPGRSGERLAPPRRCRYPPERRPPLQPAQRCRLRTDGRGSQSKAAGFEVVIEVEQLVWQPPSLR